MRIPPIRQLAVVCLASFVLAGAVLHAFGTFTPLWYANAVGVAALVRQPRTTWPVLLLALYAVDALAFTWFAQGAALLYAACHVVEIALAAWLVQRVAGMPGPLLEGNRFARLTAVFLLAPAVSATAGAVIAVGTEGASFVQVLQAWYLASALGLLVAGVPLLGWTDAALRRDFMRQLTLRGAAILLAGAAVSAFLVHERSHQAAIFLTFPIMFALTWFFGLLGATVALLVTTVSAVVETLQGHGVFIVLATAQSAVEAPLETVQLYLAALLLSSMPLAVLHEQQQVLTAQARSAGEARSEFLAAMSHEIRTPMTAVLGMVDLLGAEPLTQRQRSYVDAMRASGRHLLSVINDILDFSRFESGRLELDRADFALADVLESVRSVMHPLAVEHGIGLETRVAPGIPPVFNGDPLRLTQVLLNLASNAVKFTHAGSVQVCVAPVPDAASGAIWLRFEVRDTGIGIEPQQLQRLFAPFVQADRSISRQYGGSGLGLAISKRLVELMGGRIGAQSAPGQGSVFHFEVPLHAGDPLRVASEREAQRPDVAPRRILVAEDVEINRRILQAALGRRGHRLAFAVNGAEAIARLEEGDFDLVLMDVQMPVMDGVEATRRIRAMAGPKAAIPILGLTANVVAREREQYLSAGMDACLMKPFDWDQVAAAIARYAGTAPPPGVSAGPAAAPTVSPGLIDEGALQGLRELGEPGDVEALVRAALESYGPACERMLAPGAAATEVRREAHDICGTSGMLGLRGIWEQAAQLEAAPEAGEMPQRVEALRRTVESTAVLLRERGLIGREESDA